MEEDLDMNKNRILNLAIPTDADEPATKQYADSHFLYRNGSHLVTGDLDMNNNRISNLPTPTAGNQPATKAYTDTHFLNVDGKTFMQCNLDMNSNRIFRLPLPNGPQQPEQRFTPTSVISTLMEILKWVEILIWIIKKTIHLLHLTPDTDAAKKKNA